MKSKGKQQIVELLKGIETGDAKSVAVVCDDQSEKLGSEEHFYIW